MASSTSRTISCSPSGQSSAKDTPVGASSPRTRWPGVGRLTGWGSSSKEGKAAYIGVRGDRAGPGSVWPIANWGGAGSTSGPGEYDGVGARWGGCEVRWVGADTAGAGAGVGGGGGAVSGAGGGSERGSSGGIE